MSAIDVASKPCSRNSSHAASARVSREDALGLPARDSVRHAPQRTRPSARSRRIVGRDPETIAVSEGAPCSRSRPSASPPTTCRTSTDGRCSAASTPRSSRARGPTPCCCSSTSPCTPPGARTARHERPTDGTPVVDVDRGGKITWHGPGQLVGYPIVRLPEPIDVVAHVRRLEGLLIDVLREYGVDGLPRRGPQRRVGAPPARRGQDRRDRRARAARRDDARLRAQLRQLARRLPRHHPVRDHGCRRHDDQRGRRRRRRAPPTCSTPSRARSRPSTPESPRDARAARRAAPPHAPGGRKLLRLEIRNAADARSSASRSGSRRARRWAPSTRRCTRS